MQTHTRSGDKESAVSARWRHREQHARAKQPAQTPCRPPSVRGREQQRTSLRVSCPAPHPSVLPLPPGPRVFPPVMENGGKGLLLRSPFSFTPRRPLRLSLLDSFCPATPLLLAQDTTPPAPPHPPPHTHACTPERPRPRLKEAWGGGGGHRGEPTDSSCCRRKSGSAPAWQRSLAASLSPVVAWVKSGVSFESCPRATHEHLQRQSRPHTSPRCRHAHTRGGRACQRG